MPRITEADLKKQIKNKSFSPVYLIYGSEQMFVKSYTKKLCEAVAGKNPSDFNYHTFSGDIDFQELAASLQIMPFIVMTSSCRAFCRDALGRKLQLKSPRVSTPGMTVHTPGASRMMGKETPFPLRSLRPPRGALQRTAPRQPRHPQPAGHVDDGQVFPGDRVRTRAEDHAQKLQVPAHSIKGWVVGVSKVNRGNESRPDAQNSCTITCFKW